MLAEESFMLKAVPSGSPGLDHSGTECVDKQILGFGARAAARARARGLAGSAGARRAPADAVGQTPEITPPAMAIDIARNEY
jgi:hypothetical protein